MLMQARIVYWERWSAKRECEELKEGVWRELIQAVSRRKTNGSWTVEHLSVMRKLVMEGG